MFNLELWQDRMNNAAQEMRESYGRIMGLGRGISEQLKAVELNTRTTQRDFLLPISMEIPAAATEVTKQVGIVPLGCVWYVNYISVTVDPVTADAVTLYRHSVSPDNHLESLTTSSTSGGGNSGLENHRGIPVEAGTPLVLRWFAATAGARLGGIIVINEVARKPIPLAVSFADSEPDNVPRDGSKSEPNFGLGDEDSAIAVPDERHTIAPAVHGPAMGASTNGLPEFSEAPPTRDE